jgi:hypothetical protein
MITGYSLCFDLIHRHASGPSMCISKRVNLAWLPRRRAADMVINRRIGLTLPLPAWASILKHDHPALPVQQ